MRGGRVAARMFWVGFAVRVLFITFAHTYKVRPFIDHFQFGWEMGRIGRALANGYGFADPFEGHTGPTAWTPPLYPLLLGGVFKVFGVYTKSSAWVILSINSLFSAATAPAVYEMARRCFLRGTGTPARGENIALWSGWLWTLYPAAMQYAVHWIWDMAVTACLFTWILVLALRVRGVGAEDPDHPQHQTLSRWIGFGLLWGLVGLTNSSLMTFLPACGLWMIWPQLRHLRAPGLIARNVVVAAACCAAVIAPWILRNERVLHAFIPMRSNFGAELYQSVLPTNGGFPWGGTVPLSMTDPEYLRYKRLGEVAFSQQQGERAKVLIAKDRPQFLQFIAKRIYMFWFGVAHGVEKGIWSPLGEAIRELNFGFLSVGGSLGLALALRNRIPGAWLFLWAFALFPVVFYVVTVQARFRHPLEPIITILIVYLFQSAARPGNVPDPVKG